MYLDSCIIVKLLAREPDSEFFDRALRGKPLTSSELAYTEVISALLARERAGAISATERRRAWQRFLAWVESGELRLEPLNFIVLRKAAQLLDHCQGCVALRSLDAIHLAAADLCQDLPLTTTDGRMREAARFLGLDVFPVDKPVTPGAL